MLEDAPARLSPGEPPVERVRDCMALMDVLAEEDIDLEGRRWSAELFAFEDGRRDSMVFTPLLPPPLFA